MARSFAASTRSKADFQALRDLVGLDQVDVADALGVKPVTIRKWEDPQAFALPRKAAWLFLEDVADIIERKSADLAARALEAAQRARADGREPEPVLLTYWRTREDWDNSPLGHSDETMIGNYWKIENAITRTTALRLAKDDTPFSIVYAQPRP